MHIVWVQFECRFYIHDQLDCCLITGQNKYECVSLGNPLKPTQIQSKVLNR